MLFGPFRKLKKLTHFNVKYKEQVIMMRDSVRYFGIYIGKYMNCEKVIISIIGKVDSRRKFYIYRN